MINHSSSTSLTQPGSAPPCLLILFGGSGDLAKRKLFPALYHLLKQGHLSDSFAMIGVARAKHSTDEYRRIIQESLDQQSEEEDIDSNICEELLKKCHYYSLDTTHPEGYSDFSKFIQQIDQDNKTQGNYLFYLATPPNLFSKIPTYLAQNGLLEQKENYWRRALFEKPFGTDYQSAMDLNGLLSRLMHENQIYRIDHYLGKETVQNIMALRFANGIFEPVWNRRYIDSVQITVAETLGVEDRGDYYDNSGALRDMVPNHLFQLVSLIGMEPPNSFEAEDVRDEKVKMIRAIKPFLMDTITDQVVRGQYGPGVLNGQPCSGYRQEQKVKQNSGTETFAAMKLEIDNWRWAGVPFYLRTGKRMARRVTEILIEFRCAPFQMFQNTPTHSVASNLLILQIQPDEKIQLRFSAKIPGPQVRLGPVLMNFDYVDAFGCAPATGYETLLFDCMKGDSTLFQRADQVEHAWRVVDPILEYWKESVPLDFPNYAAGAWGPWESDQLLLRDGRRWFNQDLTLIPPLTEEKRAA
jgi:glucose-6-phosphate 1-dehydrogenase